MTVTTGSAEGRLIAGRYRLHGLLGAGGMGEVWSAEDERLDRHVAVKLISSAVRLRRAELRSDPDGARLSARFRREAKIAAALSGHPNIVTVYDFGEDPLHVVMELVQGTPLDVRVRREGLPAPAEVVAWGAQVCDALATAHARGVVHRDLKPSNLILTGGRTVKVLDFGLAALLEGGIAAAGTSLTAEGAFVGTAPYAAPEQIRGRGVDSRADLYALGCLLYELTAGTPPFGKGPKGDVAVRQLMDEPPPLRADRPDVTPEFERLVLDLLAKEPERRPQDAQTVRERLSRLVLPRPEPAASAAGAPPQDLVTGFGRTGGLRLARVFDLHAPDGSPAIGAAHERIVSAQERAALLECLRDARAVVLLPREPDRVEPACGRVVPAIFRTDGTWVWSDQIAYYLDRYGYAPDPGLRRHFATRQEPPPQVTARVCSQAGRLVLAEPEGSLTGRPASNSRR